VLFDTLKDANARGDGVHIYVNELDGKGYKAENAKAVRACFVDNDNGPLVPTPAKPAIVAQTVRGQHGYWLLKEDQPIDLYESVQRGLSKALKTDDGLTKANHTMRLPGFFHLKGSPALVTCRIDANATRYGLEELASAFGFKAHKTDRQHDPDALKSLLSGCDRNKLIAQCHAYMKAVKPATQGDGGDNATFRACAIGGDFGLTVDEFKPIILEWNSRCLPPWPVSDLETKISNAYKYRDKPFGIKHAEWMEHEETRRGKDALIDTARRDTEADLSNALIDTLETDGRVISTTSLFYRYSTITGVWSPIKYHVAKEAVRLFDGGTVLDNGRPTELKLSSQRVKGVYDLALSNGRVCEPEFFVEPKAGVAFTNGFVRVDKDGVHLNDHAPDNRVRHAMGFAYDADAPFDKWAEILCNVFGGDDDADQKRALLQEFVGACLCGIATQYDKCVVFEGGGGNGKSTIQQAITDNLFPPASISHVAPQRWSTDHYLSGINDALINVVSELPGERILTSEIFKAVVSGDPVQGRDLYKTAFVMRPQAGHLFACNELPGTNDTTAGFWERFIVVKFNRAFRKESNCRTRDDILSELHQQAPGIMVWALNGAVRLLRNGHYTVPKSTASVMEEWQEDSDSVLAWKTERTTPCIEPTTTPDAAYHDYKSWCDDSGRKPVAINTFTKRLARAGAKSIPSGHWRKRKYTIEIQ
jgi:P4 family phage/plasmid primase-like protien